MSNSPSGEQAAVEATPKERNELLVGLLKDHYAGLLDFEFKHGAFLTLILGWILSSETARKTFAADGIAVGVACGAMLILTVLHAVWVRTFFTRSRDVYERIVELNYIPTRDVESRRITRLTRWSFTLFHLVVSVTACVLIVRATG
jgi:hypothetical protein